MDFRVEISRLAETDVEDTFNWLQERSEDVAVNWYISWLTAKRSLESLPNRCPVAPETRSFLIDIRHLLFGDGTLQSRIIFGVSVAENSGEGIVTIYRVRLSRRRSLSSTEILGVDDYE